MDLGVLPLVALCSSFALIAPADAGIHGPSSFLVVPFPTNK